MLIINMYTIDIDVAEKPGSPLRWFSLPFSPFDHKSPKNLFSPSLSLEVLSPPRNVDNAGSPELWDDPSHLVRPLHTNILRDCYISQVYNTLEYRAEQAFDILKGKNSTISSDDIHNTVDNIIDNEVLCSKLNHNYLADIQKRILEKLFQSLSSSAETAVESAE